MQHWVGVACGAAFAWPLMSPDSTQSWLLAFFVLVGVVLVGVLALWRRESLQLADGTEAVGTFMPRTNRTVAGAVAALVMAAVFTCSMAGCSKSAQSTTYQIVQQISTYAPTVEAALESTATAVAALDPAIAGAIMVGVTAFDALSTAFNAALNAYLKHPTATTLQQLQSAINAIETSINTASLNALGIKDKVSQALAVSLLKSILTVATYVFGLISQTESQAQLQQLVGQVQLSRLRPLMDERQLERYAVEQGAPRLLAGMYVDNAFDAAASEGF